MIVQNHGDQLILIRQTDHAVLAGFFARAWGNDHFGRPAPFDSFCLAAAEHDNGWTEWELLPEVDPATFSPYSFMSIPTGQHIALYQHGIERVVKVDHYAGLLVSMHCAGLYDRARATMPGYSAKYVKANEANLVNEFLQKLRLQQLRLKVDVRANLTFKEFTDDKSLQANLQRLEALDRLSLYFCLGPQEGATIESVPSDAKGHEMDWVLRPDGTNTVTISPYPFRKDPLEISILGRRIPKRRYTDNADLQRTLSQSPYFAMNFTVREGNARVQTRAVGL
jgi:Protein of unknown function (DUF3891)